MRAKHAAGFVLLALGTNQHGGFSRFMEACADAPQYQSKDGFHSAGSPAEMDPIETIYAVVETLPYLRAEFIAEIMAALQQPCAKYRLVALEAAGLFPKELAQRPCVGTRKVLIIRVDADLSGLLSVNFLPSRHDQEYTRHAIGQ